MYLTYIEYKDMGGGLPKDQFIRQESAARKEIDRHTFDRLQGIDPAPDDLKMCVLELVQRGLCGDLNGDDFTSQGAGRVSGTREDRQKRMCEIIRRYLDGMNVNGAPVFYAGNVCY